MSVHRRGDKWEVRFRDGSRQRSKTFDRKADADVFDTEARRRRQLGTLASLTAGHQTFDRYVEDIWAPTYTPALAANTISGYTYLVDNQISPWLGLSRLRELTADQIRAWQAALLRDGCPADQAGRALGLLGNVLERARESGLIATNPARLVRKPPRDEKPEVRPLAPETVEAIRRLLTPRDRMLVALLAYGGLRPQEAVRLRWGHVRERTLVVHAPKTRRRKPKPRTVKQLAPLAQDLREWRLACGRPASDEPVIPGASGGDWSDDGYYQWRGKVWTPTLKRAGVPHQVPYAMRHSFASLLLHERRSVIYVARQLGHDATLTLKTYGHVIDELDDQPAISAEDAIRAARAKAQQVPRKASG
jgi:integrase